MSFPNLDAEYEAQLNVARKLIMKIKDKSGKVQFELNSSFHKIFTTFLLIGNFWCRTFFKNTIIII